MDLRHLGPHARDAPLDKPRLASYSLPLPRVMLRQYRSLKYAPAGY